MSAAQESGFLPIENRFASRPASWIRSLAPAAAAIATPIFGLACAYWLAQGARSPLELRAGRLAYISIGVPLFFVLIGVALGLLHLHLSDELVWIACWSAVSACVLFGTVTQIKAEPQSVAKWRVTHGASAAVIALYVLFHLTNHLFGLGGAEAHAAVMKMGRHVYRSRVVEPILIGLLLFQVVSGARLAWRWSSLPADAYRVFQIGSGAYLSAFILAHLNSALISARAIHKIDHGLGVGVRGSGWAHF